ncbi:iron complex outermembrane recepter protein [Dyella sp. OK004]|uniref:TonB-dependent receptor plug domain-containing protein n=1 Tax=Dyella sp. OK004 TaxID=1855292 RepID=UPI0008E8481E|nr:TonB-dependent receptor [Dyella sp. OK004]SFS18495.1 iron complex outermembrane recepter protein [Dyella sp. OK004]
MRAKKSGGCTVNGRGKHLLASSISKSVMAMQLAWGLGGLAFAGTVFAQVDTSAPADAAAKPAKKQDKDAAPEKAVRLQQVTVTGSNIRSVDVADAQPVITIDRVAIERQGFATVGQILQNISSAATPDLSMSAPGDLGPNQGGQFINLRGLGAPRTLVLVDGQRIGAAHGGYTNVNVIPASVIDHIDVLANGASAIYGSDAIAGVINIITRKNYNGAEINTYNGIYSPHGDGMQSQYDFTFGKSTDKWGVVFSASYQNQRPVWTSSRDFSSYPWTDRHPYYGRTYVGLQPIISNAAFPDGSHHAVVLNQGGDPFNLGDYHRVRPRVFNDGGDVGSLADAGDYTYNNLSGHQNMLRTADTTKNLYLDTHYNITSNITAHFNAGYNIDHEKATAGTSTMYSGMGGHDDFPSLLSADSYYNPYNQPGVTPQDVKFYRKLAGITFNSYNNPKNYRYSVGLEGNFSMGDHLFNWDVNYYDSKITGVNTRTGYFNLLHARDGLGPSFKGADGVVRCGTPGNVIAGCVPVNALGTLTSEMLQYLQVNSVEHYGSEEKAATADFGGNLFALPGGDFSFATGVQHRTVSGYDSPDSFAAAGYSTDGAVGPNKGSYFLNEAYAEVNAPLAKDLPGIRSLSLDAAIRYSNYSNFGSTTNSSFKLTWQPIEDLLVRASYGTGFRAPTVNDLYQGRYNAGGFTDPCDAVYGPAGYGYSPVVAQRCLTGFGGLPGVGANFRQVDLTGLPVTQADAAGITESFNGGNPHLKPETSYNGQVGLVFSPSWLQGFNFTLDYWRYNIRNLITGITNDQVLANCYQFGIASSCGQFQRQAGSNQIINLLNLETNAGWQKTSGYDFSFAYALPKYSFGQFKLGLSGTYVDSYNMLPTLGSAEVHGAGIASSQTAMSVWRLRGNFTIDWSWHDFGANWTMRYFSPLKAPCAFPPPDSRSAFPCSLPDYYAPGSGPQPMTQIASVTFNDAQVYWKAPWNGTFSLGANNVFNRKGPYVYGGYAGSDTPYNYNASYDIGRYVYLRYQQKF